MSDPYTRTRKEISLQMREDARRKIHVAARYLQESSDPNEWREQLADALIVIANELARLDVES